MYTILDKPEQKRVIEIQFKNEERNTELYTVRQKENMTTISQATRSAKRKRQRECKANKQHDLKRSKVREVAMRTIFQFRSTPEPLTENCNLIEEEVLNVQEDITKDLENHFDVLEPKRYIGCSSCGKQFYKGHLTSIGRGLCKDWLQLLEHKTYGNDSGLVYFCDHCKKKLKSGKTSKFSLCKGWVFKQKIPHELSSLNKHEVLLISLRLPWIPIWRDIPGYSQYASKRTPVSFSNPVAQICNLLPRNPNVVFKSVLDNGQKIEICSQKVVNALNWLRKHNKLYRWITINNESLNIINTQYSVHSDSVENHDSSSENVSSEDIQPAEAEKIAGAQGPLDEQALEESSKLRQMGVLDIKNSESVNVLIRHMLQPFKYRLKDLIPSYDATKNLESYFPSLFPHGTGGPEDTHTHFATWISHCLEVKDSRFSKNLPFLFFANSVHQRARLTGLSMNARIIDKCSNAIMNVRKLLEGNLPRQEIIKRIDKLIRSGTISASFEKLKGSPAYWARMKRTAWTYLTFFGPCQLFVTMSVADLTDPFIFMEIDSNLSYVDASNLSSQKRAQYLAENPVVANCVFHRRVQSLLDNFLFGKTRPFGQIEAYLGRVEMQARHSPHLHLLVWTEKKIPHIHERMYEDNTIEDLIEYLEIFNTASRPLGDLIDSEKLSPVNAKLPIPTFKSIKKDPKHKIGLKLNRGERHSILTEKLDPAIFNRSEINNKKIGDILRATQTHICNDYCTKSDEQCRFGFPFPRQDRASVCIRRIDNRKSHYLALAPRQSPYLNKTHPLLAVMARSNTDVTVILGKGIAESMYVSNYAVKSDKDVLFNKNALKKLYKVMENDPGEKQLLSSIARGSLGAKIVGAQEAVSSLLGSPLVFQSAAVTNVSIKYFLTLSYALSETEKKEYLQNEDLVHESLTELLPDLDQDVNVCNPSVKESDNVKLDSFLRLYVRRPTKFEALSALEFNTNYKIVKLKKNRKNFDKEDVLLGPTSFDEGTKFENTSYIVEERKSPDNRPKEVDILNVIDKGIVDDESPRFAAAALSVNVPFRTIEDMLENETLTSRLRTLLSTESLPGLNHYVSRCHELCITLNQDNIHKADEDEVNDKSDHRSGSDEGSENDNTILAAVDFEDIEENDKEKFTSLRPWTNADKLPTTAQLQIETYKEYVSVCKSKGITYANSLLEDSDNENTRSKHRIETHDVNERYVISFKNKLFRICKTDEQRDWMKSVLSYIEVYFSNRSKIPIHLLDICKKNHPILTNAPGGCGKSWLISKLKSFIINCIPPTQKPNFMQCDTETRFSEMIELQVCNVNTRLGRVATFAPSGVAAANCDGFTFHNGLYTHQITRKELNEDLSPKTLQKLRIDFMHVQCIVIDEFSMVSLVILAYLNKILISIFPNRSNTIFAGIIIVISGDGFQLPVVHDKGILCDSNKIGEDSTLFEIHSHFNIGAFFLELKQSVRQASDMEYSNILMRMRESICTEEDAYKLNQRYFPSLETLATEGKSWKTAPVLTGTNETVHDINEKSTIKNANNLGAFCVHNIPVTSKSSTKQKVEYLLNKFWKLSPSQSKIRTVGKRFTAPPVIYLYHGMPVMLRINICPSLGLCNGSIGTIVAVLRNGLPPLESVSDVKERVMSSTPESTFVPSVLVDFKNYYKGQISVLKEEDKMGSNSSSTVLIEPHNLGRIRGLPLSPAHSITMHKSQSLTIPHCIIDPRNTFVMGQLYVAFSRAPGLKNIALLAPVTIESLNKFRKSCQRINLAINLIAESSTSFKPFIDFIQEKDGIIDDTPVENN